jgi:actin related protein 2/3 complex subunit 2
MAFVQLGADNKVLKESIQSKLEAEKKEPCDAKLYDFDDVFYRLFVDPDDRSKLLIELTTPNWSQIRSKGAVARIKETLGDYLTNFGDDGASFKINLDDEKTCSKSVEVAEAFSKLRMYALGGPLYDYCKALQAGSAKTAALDFKLRRDTHCWIVPNKDRIAVVLGMEFPIKTDRIIGNQILTEFLEVRRQKDLQAAPVISYDKKPPAELKGCNQPNFNQETFLGYFTILLLPNHVKEGKLEVAVENVVGFRAYLTYHIKCAKAFFHQSMRARVKKMLQILNRARYEADDTRKKKKIITSAK